MLAAAVAGILKRDVYGDGALATWDMLTDRP
jgi:hypothetical protein